MRLTLPIVPAVLAAMLACAPPVPVAPPAQVQVEPAWLASEATPDGLGAVGLGQPKATGDKNLQRAMAVRDAHGKLAGQLRIKVQDRFNQANGEVIRAAAEGKGKPLTTEALNRIVLAVTRLVEVRDLAGPDPRATWTDPADHTLYVFLVIPGQVLDRALAVACQSAVKAEFGDVPAAKVLLDTLDAVAAASRH
jgi:hypothetical protein